MLPVPTWLLQLGIAIVISAIFLWKYSVREFDYWKKRGVYYVEPTPIVGNLWDVVFFEKGLSDWLSDLYFSIDEKFFGIFIFNEPSLIIKDPKIVQLVMIKDSDNFINRSTADPPDEITKNLTFFQKGSEWKTTRTKLTPVFTPAKLKGMFHTINNIGDEIVRYLTKHQGQIEAKDVSSRYTTDVIAKCAFGIDSYCFDENDSDFKKFGKRMFDFSFKNGFAQMSYFFLHNWVRFFQISFIESTSKDYFCRAFTQSMASRVTTNTKANDFLDLLIELKNSEKSSDESETLRKYPVVPFLTRECNADYAVPGTDLVIEKGTPVYIPSAGLHMDEKYFPDPRRYNPDRFIEKNQNENGLFYMPFGEGPRKCIGDRFGFMYTQLGLIHILSNFEVVRCADTPDPVEFELKSLLNLSKVGLPMRLRRITPIRVGNP